MLKSREKFAKQSSLTQPSVAIEKQETIVVESKNTQALKYPNIMVKIEEQGTEFLNFKVTRQKSRRSSLDSSNSSASLLTKSPKRTKSCLQLYSVVNICDTIWGSAVLY